MLYNLILADRILPFLQTALFKMMMVPSVLQILSVIVVISSDSLIFLKVNASFVASTESMSSFIESHQGKY